MLTEIRIPRGDDSADEIPIALLVEESDHLLGDGALLFPAALEQVKALGYLQAPVVIADEDHWSGFRPDKIDELASRLA